jgi:hypothetical protein
MLKKIYNKWWVRPQLFVAVPLFIDAFGYKIPDKILNIKGVLASCVNILHQCFYIILCFVMRWDDKKFIDTKKHKDAMEYIEKNGYSKYRLTSADKYYFLKKYILWVRYIMSGIEMKQDLSIYHNLIAKAKKEMKELYEDALVLGLAEIEK